MAPGSWLRAALTGFQWLAGLCGKFHHRILHRRSYTLSPMNFADWNLHLVHAYERSNRVYRYQLNSCGPVYITVGDGGNVERLDVVRADDDGQCPTPQDSIPDFGGICPFNFTLGPAAGKYCWDTQPD